MGGVPTIGHPSEGLGNLPECCGHPVSLDWVEGDKVVEERRRALVGVGHEVLKWRTYGWD